MKHKIRLIVFLLMLTFIFSGCSILESKFTPKEKVELSQEGLSVHFLDVGQADATLLLSAGKSMLIDAGNRDDKDQIMDYLDQYSIEKLDYLILTHPHEDHIGSAKVLVENYEIDQVYLQGEYETETAKQLLQAIEEKKIASTRPKLGEKFSFGECEVEFFGPDTNYKDTNDDSICLMVRHGENDFLFTGDAGSAPEKAMVNAKRDLEAEVLQVGHHGSRTSSSYLFLREVNPEYAVISCGTGNDYGHPHEEALSRFNDVGAELFRTDQLGTVVATSDKQNLSFDQKGKESTRDHVSESAGEVESYYIGNKNSKKLHSPTCSNLPEKENQVELYDYEAAIEAGYQPCGNCKPEEKG